MKIMMKFRLLSIMKWGRLTLIILDWFKRKNEYYQQLSESQKIENQIYFKVAYSIILL